MRGIRIEIPILPEQKVIIQGRRNGRPVSIESTLTPDLARIVRMQSKDGGEMLITSTILPSVIYDTSSFRPSGKNKDLVRPVRVGNESHPHRVEIQLPSNRTIRFQVESKYVVGRSDPVSHIAIRNEQK